MQESIVIQLGTRGANVGSSFWRQISAEHGIAKGAFIEEKLKHQIGHNWKNYFHEREDSKITPRSVIIDLDLDRGNDVPFAQYADHYDYEADFIVHNTRKNMSALSEEEISQIEATILKQVERCDRLGQCLIIRDSTEATSHLISRLSLENAGLAKKHLHDFAITADRNSANQQFVNTVSCQPLFFNGHYPVRFLMQDVAIQRQVQSKNNQSKLDLNRFVAKTLSGFTDSERRSNPLAISLTEIYHTDPYPSLNFTVPSYATPQHGMPCETDPLSESLVAYSMHNNSLLCDVDFNFGYYMRIHMFARGLSSPKVQSEIVALKKRQDIQFVSWCPSGFKVGLSEFKHCYDSSAKEFKLEESSVCAALHNTNVRQVFKLWTSKIEELKRTNQLQQIMEQNNIEEEAFAESFEALKTMFLDYTEIHHEEEMPDDEVPDDE